MTNKSMKNRVILHQSNIMTPLGMMLVISDERLIYFLAFTDSVGLQGRIEQLQSNIKSHIIIGMTNPIISITKELHEYFSGSLKYFHTPYIFLGTLFQKKVWTTLLTVSYGETRSYAEQAMGIHNPLAYRAVAHANSLNRLTILVPCHRIICNNGNLGGYSGNNERKKWLLMHEASNNIIMQ